MNHSRPPAHDLHGASTPTQTVTDPVCGMQVEPTKTEHHTVHAGVSYAFCSRGCRDKFTQNPQTYLRQTEAPSKAPEAGVYTCPMHPEVEQAGPGACPRCGMALEPKEVKAPKTTMQYTCPMHPGVIQDGPGFCPKCDMALEPITVTAEDEVEPELQDMTRRFWISAVLTLPVILLAMGHMIGLPVHTWIAPRLGTWLELILATPVVLWGGKPFFVRAYFSVKTMHRISTCSP